MNRKIAAVLIQHGEEIFNAKPREVQFTHSPAADALLNDLEHHPHAFVLASIMDRQIKAERAWLIPYLLSQKLGDFSFKRLAFLSIGKIQRLLTKPEPLHRFPKEMSRNFHAAVALIGEVYAGDASLIWRDRPPSAEVVLRFLQFRGVGPKIATMATNILAREFKIPLADYYSVDVSADIHVRRVFQRLGLVRESATVEDIVYSARALHPSFPGLLDLPAWQIGRTWCRPKAPRCPECYMREHCPTARDGRAPAG